MNLQQIEFVKSLDPEQRDGTIQSVFLGRKLSEVPFEEVAKHLLKNLKNEKDFLIQDNIKLSNIINKGDLK